MATAEPIGFPSKGVYDRRRLWDQVGGYVGLLAGAILLTVSMFEAWWTFSATGGGGSESVSFFPGSSYIATGSANIGILSGTQT
ncbi:MAG: hypothetical protein ACLPZM_05645 [Thermoplasmata archaeon]